MVGDKWTTNEEILAAANGYNFGTADVCDVVKHGLIQLVFCSSTAHSISTILVELGLAKKKHNFYPTARGKRQAYLWVKDIRARLAESERLVQEAHNAALDEALSIAEDGHRVGGTMKYPFMDVLTSVVEKIRALKREEV